MILQDRLDGGILRRATVGRNQASGQDGKACQKVLSHVRGSASLVRGHHVWRPQKGLNLVVGQRLHAGFGFGVVHAAVQIFPIRHQHRGFRQEVCPRIARHLSGLGDDVKLTVFLNFANQNWLRQVMVWQHHGGTTGQVREFLTVHLGPHRIHLGGASFGGGVQPHVKADEMCFHWIVGHTRVTHGGFPCFHKFRVHVGIRRLEVVPCREVTHEVGSVQPSQLFFANRERHNRNVVRRNASRRQFFVEADVRVTVDGGDHANFFAVRAQRHNVSDDLGPVRVPKWGVVHENVVIRDTFALQIRLKDVVGRAWIDIVGAQEGKFLNTQLVQEVVGCRDRLLVWRCTGVKHVFGALFAFVLNRVEQQAVQLFDHWQHRFTRHGGPVAEDHIHFMHGQKLTRFFCKQWPVRCRVNHNCFQLFAQQAALGVLLVDQHQHGVFQRGLRNRHRARERVQHTHFDGVFVGHGSAGKRGKNQRSCERGFQKGHSYLPAGWPQKLLRPEASFHYLIPATSCCKPCGGRVEVQFVGRHTPPVSQTSCRSVGAHIF
mmetsp:Transcript_27187/g.49637  ORF Transcript_27187/g.49637 Transcript_27187/m.49637 type:complete len:545 (+) Transcript_27187:1301-2935(+)